jgi:hypothetical protein
MSATLVQRLRDSVTQCRALDRSALLEEAAAEIERLRGSPVTEPMPKEKRAEGSAVLTDAEREAISRIYDLLNERSRELQVARRIEESTPYVQLAKTLQTMWERLK